MVKKVIQDIQPLIVNGGTSPEQGRFWDPAKLIQTTVPMKGLPANMMQKPTIKTSGITTAIKAMLTGNKRIDVGRGKFKIFPTSADEANHPQVVRRAK